jgi:hypothetical protein
VPDETTDSAIGALGAVLSEIVNGPAREGAFLLNREDEGLLRSLDKLSSADASRVPPSGGASIAAHVDHLCYGLGLLVRWNNGEEPFHDANFSASWQRVAVSDRDATRQWQDAIRHPRATTQPALTEVIASVAHLAYHLGAIRQIDRSIRGPAARD